MQIVHILALESSTSSAKAMYYDTESDTYELKARVYDMDYAGIRTAFRPDRVYENMTSLARELVAGRPVDVVTLSSEWHSIGLFDRDFRPCTPMYQWSDSYGAEVSKRLRNNDQYVLDYYSTTGCMVNSIYPFFKLLKMSEEHDLQDYRILGQGSYNNFRLTGKNITTDCLLSASGLLDIRKLTYALQVKEQLGVSYSQLSEIADYKMQLSVCERAAAELGIKEGTPLILSCADGALNQVGAGALAEGTMTLSVGTSGAIRLSSNAPHLSEDYSTWCYRSPVSWMVGAAINGGTNCIEWFRRLAFDKQISYEEIEGLASERADGPVFLPFVYGERCPGWRDDIRGGFCGLADGHSKYDMYLAIEEGILFNLKQCYQKLTALQGEPERIRLSGGILYSKKWTQMCADIFGREMEIDRCEQASLMGAVALGKERLGIIEDIKAYFLDSSDVIKPDKNKTEMYNNKYSSYLNYYYSLN